MSHQVKQVVRDYNIEDRRDFERFLYARNDISTSSKLTGMQFEGDVEEIVRLYRLDYARREMERLQQAEDKRQAELDLRRQEDEKRQALASMLISSGFSFDGYRITRYSGYISGDDAISVPRGKQGIFSNPTNVAESLMGCLTKIRANALAELKEAAYALGCNAVIGVDFDYLTLDPETISSSGTTVYLPYVFGVTANGNAVVIEKIESPFEE